MKSAQTLIFLLIAGLIASCGEAAEHDHHEPATEQVYTCPMHPEIIRNEPGQCPICGMKLVPKVSDGESTEDSSVSILLKPVNQIVLSQVAVISPQEKEINLNIPVNGLISYDSRELNTVSARVSGWIEKHM